MFVAIIFMSICFIFLPILLCILCSDENYVYTHRCTNCNQVMYVKNPPVRKNTTYRHGRHSRVHNSSHHHGSRSNRIHNTHNNFGRRDSDNSIISSHSDMEMNHTRHRMHWYSFHHFYFIYLCQKLINNRDLFKKKIFKTTQDD